MDMYGERVTRRRICSRLVGGAHRNNGFPQWFPINGGAPSTTDHPFQTPLPTVSAPNPHARHPPIIAPFEWFHRAIPAPMGWANALKMVLLSTTFTHLNICFPSQRYVFPYRLSRSTNRRCVARPTPCPSPRQRLTSSALVPFPGSPSSPAALTNSLAIIPSHVRVFR